MALKIAQLFEFIHKLRIIKYIIKLYICTILVVSKYKLNLILNNYFSR